MTAFLADLKHGIRVLLRSPLFTICTIAALTLGMRRFGGDPSVVGRAVTINGAPVVVIGVMPPGFEVLGQRADCLPAISARRHGAAFQRPKCRRARAVEGRRQP